MKFKGLFIVVFLMASISMTSAATVQLNFANGWTAEFDDAINSLGFYGIPDITDPEQELSGGIDWVNLHTRTQLSYVENVNALFMREHRYIANGTNNYLQLTATITGSELNLDEFLSYAADNNTTFIAEYSYTRNYQTNYKYEVENTTLSPVPLPGAIWLLGSGIFGIIGLRKKQA